MALPPVFQKVNTKEMAVPSVSKMWKNAQQSEDNVE